MAGQGIGDGITQYIGRPLSEGRDSDTFFEKS